MKLFARLVVALAAVSTLALTAPAEAADSPVLSRIVKNGILRVGMSGNQPPLNFKNKSGQMRGLEVDLSRALASLMDVKLEIVEKPFGELLGALDKSEIDMVISGMTITAERNLKTAFVGPYFLSGKSILAKMDSPLVSAQETGELNQSSLKLAALSGSTSQRFVEVLMPEATLVASKDYDEAVQHLIAGRADALIADYQIVALTAFLNPKENLVASQDPLTIEPIGIAVPPGDGLLLNFLENALDALETSGTLDALQKRWFREKDWLQELP